MAFDTIVDRVQLESALTATANSIRAKTGGTNKIIWDLDKGFAEQIADIQAGVAELNPPGVIPANLRDAALEVVNKVNTVRKDDSIVFLAMSDSHHTGEQSNTGWQELTNLGNLHAGMAAKVISYALNLDFVCHLGDITFGHGTTTSDQLHQQIDEMNSWLDEAWRGIPRFQTVGNHDTGLYGYDNTDGTTPMETNEYLFSVFGKYCEGAIYGSDTFGYCYRDFNDKKLRVICLNTSEGDSLRASYECSSTQLLWFARTLQDVGKKIGWNVIVLGHYPLDYVGMHDATAVVKAYIDGASITLNGTSVSFSGSNNAKFIANFHGHTHCFKTARLNILDTSTHTATEYDAWRVSIPNTGFYRNNHQIGPNAYGLYFEEDKTYNKENDGINDTAFVVNVITPSEEVIYSFCYGAGPDDDRVVNYGDVVHYKIIKNLSNCTLSNNNLTIEHGQPYTTEITLSDHCTITSISITMGGVDYTNEVYSDSDGIISIPAVTGDLVITVKAEIAWACTNQIPISTDVDGSIYNGCGYKNESRIASDGSVANGNTYVTGFIPIAIGDVIRFKDLTFSATGGTSRLWFYKSDKTVINQANGIYFFKDLFGGTIDSNNCVNNMTITSANDLTVGAAYMRVQADKISESSILTLNEEIKYVDEVENVFAVSNNLTNAINSNASTTVRKGESYTANITAMTGYELQPITVMMGGKDITNEVCSNGVINIGSVTGDIVITANATVNDVVIEGNLLPEATDTDGTVFNGTGYKEGVYLSSGAVNDNSIGPGADSGITTTGFIPCTVGDTLYFKNIGMQKDQNYHRILFYKPDKSYIAGIKTTVVDSSFPGLVYGSDGNIVSFKIPSGSSTNGMGYIRFCCSYIGENSIVTVNEPIE